MKPVIAIVDDEALFRTWLAELLGDAGYDVAIAQTGEEGAHLVRAGTPAVVLLDLRLPDGSGIDFLHRYHEIDRDLAIIMMTAYGEIETAVEAVKAGAYHFLQKPVDRDDLLITLEKAIETSRLRSQIASLREQHRWHFASIELVGRSGAIRRIVELVEKVARSDSATVLLLGESGTGKDLVARAIHNRSDRRDSPFLPVNCTAIPEHLFESELFGHERGAFTDARERKKGLAELASGGTLFLDEIGDVSPAGQAKLLRFLEEGSFKRVGGTVDLSVNVRVIAATNRDLDAAVRDGSFRSDLFYRLNVVPIHIPPLRDRPEDIEPLVLHFVDSLSRDLKCAPPTVSPEAIDLMRRYDWPGNARELRNVLERALILEVTDEVRPEHLPDGLTRSPRGRTAGSPTWFVLPADGVHLDDVERDLIEQAMGRTGGNVSQAARLLGISRDTLRYRLEKIAAGNPGTGIA